MRMCVDSCHEAPLALLQRHNHKIGSWCIDYNHDWNLHCYCQPSFPCYCRERSWENWVLDFAKAFANVNKRPSLSIVVPLEVEIVTTQWKLYIGAHLPQP